MRFGTPSRRAGSIDRDRGQQQLRRRLIRLITFLVLTLVLMRHAADPAQWQWFWMVAPAAPEPRENAQRQVAHIQEDASHWVPGLDVGLLETVQDDSHFRRQEHEVWFHLLERLRDTPDEALRAASGGPATYLQIYRQTPSYRGKLVDLQGTIRRAHRLPAPKNDVGMDHYWQCWLFLEGSGNSPVVVYLLEPPADFPEGMEISVPVALTGCVYKRWAYASGDVLHVAPVVLAAELQPVAPIEPTVQPPGKNESTRISPWWIAGLALLAAGLAWKTAQKTKHRSERLADSPWNGRDFAHQISSTSAAEDDADESTHETA